MGVPHNKDTFINHNLLQAEETWGRIRTGSCITAANMFKVSGPNNGLVISRTHHILELG